MSSFAKEFDELYNALQTDWQNQFPDADLSKGSMIYIKNACLASALWGLYKYQDWITKQIFADTADVDYMEHHAWVRGLSRKSGETDAELLTRYLDYIRRPPAGGNKYDYVKWALTIDNVDAAYSFPLGQGLGTVDVLIIADSTNTGSELPSSHAMTGTVTDLAAKKLINSAANFTAALPVRIGDVAVNEDLQTTAKVTAIDSSTQLTLNTDIFTEAGQAYTIKSLTVQVKEYIDDVRPVTAKAVQVLPPTLITQNVTMTVTGTGIDKTKIATEITSYINSLAPGRTLYLSRLIAIAIRVGAENATISVPTADVDPGDYEMIRPGTITVQ